MANMLDKDDIQDKRYIEYEKCEKIAPKKVIDKFHKEIIKSKNAPWGQFPIIPVLDNLIGSYNVPRIIRTANVFNVREVFIIGTEYFNPYPAVGAVRHTRISFFKKPEDAINKLISMDYEIYAMYPPHYKQYTPVALWDINPEQILQNKKGIAFIAGNEAKGITFDITQYPIKTCYIPQFGKVESLNVSVAMSIVIYEMVRAFEKFKSNESKTFLA